MQYSVQSLLLLVRQMLAHRRLGVIMAKGKVPYVPSYGRISTVLDQITKASVPDRFTQDFLATTLGLKGGSASSLIPFLKRTGFLGSDGSPTDLYRAFRNSSRSGAAAAEAMRRGYAPIYELNEYAHTADDDELKGLVVQLTGAEAGSSTVAAILGSFKALRGYANFDQELQSDEVMTPEDEDGEEIKKIPLRSINSVNLGYTINLNLPATSDIAVFNAIFKSLKEHIL